MISTGDLSDVEAGESFGNAGGKLQPALLCLQLPVELSRNRTEALATVSDIISFVSTSRENRQPLARLE